MDKSKLKYIVSMFAALFLVVVLTIFCIKISTSIKNKAKNYSFNEVKTEITYKSIISKSEKISMEKLENLELSFVREDLLVEFIDKDDDGILVELIGSDWNSYRTLKYEVNDKNLNIFSEYNKSIRAHHDKHEVKVFIPKNLIMESTEFSVNNVSGNTRLSNFDLKRLNVNSVSGSVYLKKINSTFIQGNAVSGYFKIKDVIGTYLNVACVSGGIFLENLNVSDSVLETVSGNINLENVDSKTVNAKSSSGNINFYSGKCENLKVKTNSGSIKVESKVTNKM